MRANHNAKPSMPKAIPAVMYGTKLQKWEQITTRLIMLSLNMKLWCMVQSYKNESKSQHNTNRTCQCSSCDVWYKVTKMRANHNNSSSVTVSMFAVMYGTKLQKWEQITTDGHVQYHSDSLWCMVQSYKNESKSQLWWSSSYRSPCCDVWYKVTKMRANHNS